MTGWRVGYALASREWTRAMLKVQGHSTSNPNSIAQRAAVEALNGPQESVAAMLEESTRRRAWLLGALLEIPGIRCSEPEGAFYAFPSVREFLGDQVKTSDEFARGYSKRTKPSLQMASASALMVALECLTPHQWSS